MHMADALLSPAVGGLMTAAGATTIGYSVKKLGRDENLEQKIPLMGVMGAFVFAAQMINFTIPGTGSSGHIGGGILLAALLGPHAALLTLASVLLIQCLFFADGGLLAYGCNVFNLGFCSCLLAYALVYRPIIARLGTPKGILPASLLASVIGLQIGAFAVVLQTLASGVAQLPFAAFAALMQPIHFAIGLAEGLITAAVLSFVYQARPQLFTNVVTTRGKSGWSAKRLLLTLLIITALTAGGLSLFASSFPDGLEWSIAGITGTTELKQEGPVHKTAEQVVEATALLPDYSFSGANQGSPLGTSSAGLLGSLITIALAGGSGLAIRALRRKAAKASGGSA